MVDRDSKRLPGWIFGLLLALLIGVAHGQDQSGSSATADGAQATGAQATGATPETGDLPETDVVSPEQQPAQNKVPEAIRQAIENQDEVHATMDRFIPTEKLSEDRAVSFPNDI